MQSIEYQRMFDLEDHNWWFQGRIDLMRRMILKHCPSTSGRQPRLLDLGCGTGIFLAEQSRDKTAFGLDFSYEALEFTRRRGISSLVCGDSQVLPFATECFDIVTAFDLIEHVDRDTALIAEAHRVLRPGGIVLIAVPAHPALFGDHDVALHHKRRYSWEKFSQLFDPAIWRRRRMTWTFSSIYPFVVLIRSVRNLRPASDDPTADTKFTPEWLNLALLKWHRLENTWTESHDLPFGLSILTIQEKISRG